MDTRTANNFPVKSNPDIPNDYFHFSEANGRRVKMAWADFLSLIDGRVDTAKDRSTHTGTQLASTISDFDTAVDARTTGHTSDNTIHFTQGQIDIPASQVNDFNAAVDARTDGHTGDNTIHFTQGQINIPSSQINDFNAAVDSRVLPAYERANHTGTQLASTISDFDAAVDARVVGVFSPLVHTHTLANITDAGSAAGYEVGLSQGELVSLDANGKFPVGVMPALAVQEYMLNHVDLTAALADAGVQASQRGDWFTTDEGSGGKTYFVTVDSPTLVGHVTEVKTATGDVSSVNGQTGAVTLTTTEIAEGINLYYTDARADARVAPAYARANHTGTQLSSTISDFNTAVDARISAIGITKVGNPSNNQFAVWTGNGTIEGVSNVETDGTDLFVDGHIGFNVSSTDSWSANFKALDGYGQALMYQTNSEDIYLLSNLYFNTSAQWKYKNANKGAAISLSDGLFRLWSAPDGAADASTTLTKLLEIGNTGTADFQNNKIKKASVDHVQVGASRDISSDDNGLVLYCDAAVTLTFPDGLPDGFCCQIVKEAAGDVTLAKSGTGSLRTPDNYLKITKQYSGATVHKKDGEIITAWGTDAA